MKMDKKMVCIIVLLAIIVSGGIGAFFYLKNNNASKEATQAEARYETNIILSEDDVNNIEKVEDTHMELEMQNVAGSDDGKLFSCYLCNAKENTYEMYLTIAEAETGELLYQSGVMPIGSRIESFEINKTLEAGSHSAIVTFHQVEADGVTEHATVSVELILGVNEY